MWQGAVKESARQLIESVDPLDTGHGKLPFPLASNHRVRGNIRRASKQGCASELLKTVCHPFATSSSDNCAASGRVLALGARWNVRLTYKKVPPCAAILSSTSPAR